MKKALSGKFKSKKSKETHHGEVYRMFKFVKALQILCVVWIIITTFGPHPIGLVQENGYIGCPRITVCAEDVRSMFFLAVRHNCEENSPRWLMDRLLFGCLTVSRILGGT